MSRFLSSMIAQRGIRLISSSATDPTLRFCVVGSGPAGFYTVDKILKRFGDNATVDLVEALPTPFGLVRSGVAPDHPDTKNVINQFSQIAQHPRVSYFGNVRVGNSVSLQELRQLYNGVVLTYGAQDDRGLGVPGEDLPGVFSAREFVWWYNGHPAYADLPVKLESTNSVVICGLGNVAVDCARVLLQPPERLSTTDIAHHALEALRHSAVRDVHLVGRRGPAQAAFTPKELRELLSMQGVSVNIDPAVLELSPACQAEVAGNRIKRRVVEVLTKAASAQTQNQGDRTLHLHFLRSPTSVTASPQGTAAGVVLERMALKAAEGSQDQEAIGTGETEEVEGQLVLKSIGYRSTPIDGAPFDVKRGIIPNTLGAVEGAGPGLFVCGWLKRGPSGIIGTNLVDAEQTVDTMVRARGALPAVSAAVPGGEGLRQLLTQRSVPVVTWPVWEKIDAAEVAKGQAVGKPREKFVDVRQMLEAGQVAA